MWESFLKFKHIQFQIYFALNNLNKHCPILKQNRQGKNVFKLSRGEICEANFIPPVNGASLGSYLLLYGKDYSQLIIYYFKVKRIYNQEINHGIRKSVNHYGRSQVKQTKKRCFHVQSYIKRLETSLVYCRFCWTQLYKSLVSSQLTD